LTDKRVWNHSTNGRESLFLDYSPWREALAEWARDNGIVPEETAGVEVWEREDGSLYARVGVYELDAEGRKMIVPGTEDYAKTIRTVPVTSPPPQPPNIRVYTSRRVTVGAMRLSRRNVQDVADWITWKSPREVQVYFSQTDEERASIEVTAPDGVRVDQGDWVVKDGEGAVRVVKNEVFHRKYEQAEA
jgi:hypothetical protein